MELFTSNDGERLDAWMASHLSVRCEYTAVHYCLRQGPRGGPRVGMRARKDLSLTVFNWNRFLRKIPTLLEAGERFEHEKTDKGFMNILW